MAVRTPGIRLEIERLVIDGLALAGRDRFLRAFTQACVAGLARARFESRTLAGSRIDIAVAHGASPEAIGTAVARGIVRLVTRP
jgi:hypothetical protein